VWFTGIATFAAVLLSLMLARREGIRLKISAQAGNEVVAGRAPPFPEILLINVRNVGSRIATIEGIAWRRRPWSKRGGLQLFDPTGGHPGPPATIPPGGAHRFTLPISRTGAYWSEWFLKSMVGPHPRIGVHLIRVFAYTPAGDKCSAWLDNSLKDWLIERAATMDAKSGATDD
jgi:hypothetical protein